MSHSLCRFACVSSPNIRKKCILFIAYLIAFAFDMRCSALLNLLPPVLHLSHVEKCKNSAIPMHILFLTGTPTVSREPCFDSESRDLLPSQSQRTMSRVKSVSSVPLILSFLALSIGATAAVVPFWEYTVVSGTLFWGTNPENEVCCRAQSRFECRHARWAHLHGITLVRLRIKRQSCK